MITPTSSLVYCKEYTSLPKKFQKRKEVQILCRRIVELRKELIELKDDLAFITE